MKTTNATTTSSQNLRRERLGKPFGFILMPRLARAEA